MDNNALETFVEDELTYGLQAAVEAKILTDVNGTSGIQTQSYATTVLATLRNGLTTLETAGYATHTLRLQPRELGRCGAGAGIQQTPSSSCACPMTRLPGGCSVCRS